MNKKLASILMTLAFSFVVSAGVPIELDQASYEKLLSDIDSSLQKLPPEWESYRIENNKLILASGAEMEVDVIKKMSTMDADALIDFVSAQGIVVKVLCSKRPSFSVSIKKHKCLPPKDFPEDFQKEPINAQYLSKYSTLTKDQTPMMFLRQDTPRYSIVHEYIHHLQESTGPTYINDYRLKSLRVGLADSMFEKGDKRDDLDKLVFQQLRLVQWLLDEVENYAGMLKYHELFGLSFADVHELFWKLGDYLTRCGNKRCKQELEKADAFFKETQTSEIRKISKTLKAPKINKALVESSLKSAKTFKSYDEWFQDLKAKLYKDNGLEKERKESVALWEEVNKPAFAYNKKEKSFEKVLTWMAKNSLLQLEALKVASELQTAKAEFRHFQSQIAADIKYFSGFAN